MEKDKSTSLGVNSNGHQAKTGPSSLQRPDLLKVLNRNPKYEYRWVNYAQVRDMGGVHPSGWRLINSLSSSEEAIIKEFGLGQISFIDGSVRRREMALAYMTREEHRQLKEAKDFDRLNQIRASRKRNGVVTKDGISHDEFQFEGPGNRR